MNNFTLTNLGKQYFAAATDGNILNFCAAEFGGGYVDKSLIPTLTSLVNKIGDMEIASKTTSDNTISVITQATNTDDDGNILETFYLNEIGIYAYVLDEYGNTVYPKGLVGYACDDSGDRITSSELVEYSFDWSFAFENTDNVTVTVSSAAYATQKELTELKSELSESILRTYSVSAVKIGTWTDGTGAWPDGLPVWRAAIPLTDMSTIGITDAASGWSIRTIAILEKLGIVDYDPFIINDNIIFQNESNYDDTSFAAAEKVIGGYKAEATDTDYASAFFGWIEFCTEEDNVLINPTDADKIEFITKNDVTISIEVSTTDVLMYATTSNAIGITVRCYRDSAYTDWDAGTLSVISSKAVTYGLGISYSYEAGSGVDVEWSDSIYMISSGDYSAGDVLCTALN